MSDLGITLKGAVGLGDALVFSSFPENYFRNTGEKVIDLDRHWVFDHNPYVVRDCASLPSSRVINLWTAEWPQSSGARQEDYIKKPVFFSMADRTSTIFSHVTYLRHPRLYRFETLPKLRNRVVLHTSGTKHPPHSAIGEDGLRILSEEILEHIREKYRGYEIIQIGSRDDVDAQVIDRRGLSDIWEVVEIIAQASIFIGVDSGPYWIAACYPGIFRKKVLMQYPPDHLRLQFVPMHLLDANTHWNDHSCYYFNRSTEDAGISYSYLKL